MPRKKRIVKSKETREQEIQLAARYIFSKKGYTAATMEEIAQQAHIAPGTIYRYFNNKEDLYASLNTQGNLALEEELVRLESEIEQENITKCRDIIMKLLNAFYLIYQKAPEEALIYANMQSGVFSRISPRSMEKINQSGRRSFSCIRRIIGMGKKKGLIKPDVNEFALADALWSTFLGLIIHEEAKKRVTGKDHVYQTLIETFSLYADALSNNA